MTHTEELIARLRDTASRGVSSWGDLQQEAADQLETLMKELEATERQVEILTDALAESRLEILVEREAGWTA